ncbi:MAG: hypothetical protein EHM45_23210 [Desulfobacteraceae bacterium]|nr:MAG: hypothetical protein EHM45_23210 [Desulfobacteraceae bacterium]
MNKKQFSEAAVVLDGIKALPFEGASEIQSLFAQTHIQLGVEKFKAKDWTGAIAELERSEEYPESLGSGKPFDADVRLQDYLIGLAAEKLGRKDKAAAAFQAVVDFTVKYPNHRGPGAYAGGLALRRAGQTAKAAEIMKTASLPSAEILNVLR